MSAIRPPLPAPDFVTVDKMRRVHVCAQLELVAMRDALIARALPQIIAAGGNVSTVHQILELECGRAALEIDAIALRASERLACGEH